MGKSFDELKIEIRDKPYSAASKDAERQRRHTIIESCLQDSTVLDAILHSNHVDPADRPWIKEYLGDLLIADKLRMKELCAVDERTEDLELARKAYYGDEPFSSGIIGASPDEQDIMRVVAEGLMHSTQPE